jgi:hypothetical protein
VVSDEYPAHLEALLVKLGDPNAHTSVLAHLVVRALLVQSLGENQVDVAKRVLQAVGSEHFVGAQDGSEVRVSSSSFVEDDSRR